MIECPHGQSPAENPCWSLAAHPVVLGEELRLTVSDAWQDVEVDQVVLRAQRVPRATVYGEDLQALNNRGGGGAAPDRATEPEYWRRIWRLANVLHADNVPEALAKAALLELVEPPFQATPILLSPLQFRGLALATTGYNDAAIEAILRDEPRPVSKKSLLAQATRSAGQPTPEGAVAALIGWGAFILDKTSVRRAQITFAEPGHEYSKPLPVELVTGIRDQLLTQAIDRYGLTSEEAIIFRARLDGMTNDEIALLGIAGSKPMVDQRSSSIHSKMRIEKGKGMMAAAVKASGVDVDSWRPSSQLRLDRKEICIVRGLAKDLLNEAIARDILKDTGEKFDSMQIGNEVKKLIRKLGANTRLQALWVALTEPDVD